MTKLQTYEILQTEGMTISRLDCGFRGLKDAVSLKLAILKVEAHLNIAVNIV